MPVNHVSADGTSSGAGTPAPRAPTGSISANIVPFRMRYGTETPGLPPHQPVRTPRSDGQRSEVVELMSRLLPPRSRLYSSKPVGIGTPLVESLTSFTARLAVGHSNTVGTLVQEEIAPRLRAYLFKDATWNASGLLCSRAYMLNGTQDLARDFIALLEELTSRPGLSMLTMQPWREVLSTQRLLYRHRVWCPVCLETWRLSGQEVYEPLLWQIQVVTRCPVHRVALRSVCPECRLSMPVLASRMLPGQCSKCQAWLGSMDEQDQELRSVPITNGRIGSGDSGHKGGSNHEGAVKGTAEASDVRTQHSHGSDREVWDSWVAEAVGEMLANPPARDKWPTRASLHDAIAAHLEVGQFASFSRAYGLPGGVRKLQRYYWGLLAPRMKTLLQVCHGLGTRPVAFLNACSTRDAGGAGSSRGNTEEGNGSGTGGKLSTQWNDSTSTSTSISKQPSLDSPKEPESNKPFEAELVRRELVALLVDIKSEPPDLTAVARRLGYDRRQLYRAFPDLSKAVAQRYMAHRKEKRSASLLAIAEEVKQATRRCYSEGLEPTQRNVGELLSKPGYMKMPQARKAREEALRGLGLGW